jgi:hypothetical protein
MGDDTFMHHVNSSKNDFSNWIKGVFSLDRLAEKISKAKTRTELKNAIYHYFFEQSQKVEISKTPAEQNEAYLLKDFPKYEHNETYLLDGFPKYEAIPREQWRAKPDPKHVKETVNKQGINEIALDHITAEKRKEIEYKGELEKKVESEAHETGTFADDGILQKEKQILRIVTKGNSAEESHYNKILKELERPRRMYDGIIDFVVGFVIGALAMLLLVKMV